MPTLSAQCLSFCTARFHLLTRGTSTFTMPLTFLTCAEHTAGVVGRGQRSGISPRSACSAQEHRLLLVFPLTSFHSPLSAQSLVGRSCPPTRRDRQPAPHRLLLRAQSTGFRTKAVRPTPVAFSQSRCPLPSNTPYSRVPSGQKQPSTQVMAWQRHLGPGWWSWQVGGHGEPQASYTRPPSHCMAVWGEERFCSLRPESLRQQ